MRLEFVGLPIVAAAAFTIPFKLVRSVAASARTEGARMIAGMIMVFRVQKDAKCML